MSESAGAPGIGWEFFLEEVERELENGLFDDMVRWRRHLHANPELSGREYGTARFVAGLLREFGADRVETEVGGSTGVFCDIAGEAAGCGCAAYRADMDALPIREAETPFNASYRSKVEGVMHACGHDVHTAIALGVARFLSTHRRMFGGVVRVIFQPAEEGIPGGERCGAEYMIGGGVLEDPVPSAVFGLHVTNSLDSGVLGCTCGPSMAAVDLFRYELEGASSHGSQPWDGRDALLAAASLLQQLQHVVSRRLSAFEPVVVSTGVLRVLDPPGGRSNIVASRVELEGTVRSFDPAVSVAVERIMEELGAGCRVAHDLRRVHLEYGRKTPVLVNDERQHELARSLFRRLFGDEAVEDVAPCLGGEDFACYLRHVPGYFFRLGTADRSRGLDAGAHTERFDIDEGAMRRGLQAALALLLGAGGVAADGFAITWADRDV